VQESKFYKNVVPTTLPPSFSTSFAAADIVPPVASKSSTSRIFAPFRSVGVDFYGICAVFEFVSNIFVLKGSLPFLRIGTKPALSFSAWRRRR